jgi:hypothetical protein
MAQINRVLDRERRVDLGLLATCHQPILRPVLRGRFVRILLPGLVRISVLHNFVHALSGTVGLVAAKTVSGARGFLLGASVTYLVLALFGSLIDLDGGLSFVPLNVADNSLHRALGLGMLAAGLTRGKASPQPAAAARATSGRAS